MQRQDIVLIHGCQRMFKSLKTLLVLAVCGLSLASNITIDQEILILVTPLC